MNGSLGCGFRSMRQSCVILLIRIVTSEKIMSMRAVISFRHLSCFLFPSFLRKITKVSELLLKSSKKKKIVTCACVFCVNRGMKLTRIVIFICFLTLLYPCLRVRVDRRVFHSSLHWHTLISFLIHPLFCYFFFLLIYLFHYDDCHRYAHVLTSHLPVLVFL